MFVCKKCKERKPSSDFYRHSAMATGFLSFCKECVKARVRLHRADNIDRIQEYDRERGLLPHRKAEVATRAHRYQRSARTMRAKYPEKYKARSEVAGAVRNGRLIKPDKCERCARDYKIQAHHDDYGKPLDVVWLCTACHGERHRELNAIKRMEAAE